MSIIIDIVLIIIIAGSTYRGYKRGIIDVGYKLFAIIVSILVALILYSPITSLIIKNTEIDERIEEVITRNEIIKNKEEDKSSGIDSYIQNYSKNIVNETQNLIVKDVARPISHNVVGVGVIFVLFIITKIILALLKTFTDIISNIPIIKQCNEFVGLIYGILVGLLIIYGLLAITFLVLSLSGDIEINTIIENTYVTKFFYNNNVILKLLF